jgi:hypothetical protein
MGRWYAALAAALLAGACSSGPGASAPLIGAVVVGFDASAARLGLSSVASVQVLNGSTGGPIEDALVSVNSRSLPFRPESGLYAGPVDVALGGPINVSVSVGGSTYSTSTTQLAGTPTITAPSGGEVWSALQPHTITWIRGGAPSGSGYVVGMVDSSTEAAQTLQQLPDGASSAQVPAGTLTGGPRFAIVGTAVQRGFEGGASGSQLVLATFAASPVNVEVGTTLATSPGPASLVVAGDSLIWSDSSDAPIKAVAIDGGPTRVLARKNGVPETVVRSGAALYWISGTGLFRSDPDGSNVSQLAQGERDPVTGTTSLLVDDDSAYWVNTVSSSACSPACNWAIVRVPLDGGPSSTVATTQARVIALGEDATSVYWEQEGFGPVSQDGSAPTDSAIRAVPKSGGSPRTVVDGFENGGPPALPPGYIPGNWFGSGGLAISGTDLYFADTNFSSYHLVHVSTSGGPVTVLRSVASGESARGLASSSGNLFWADRSSINALPLDGGAAVPLASGIDQVTGFSFSAGKVVWTETVCCAIHQNGMVRSVPAGGGPPATLASTLDNPGPLFSDGTEAYWVEGGAYGRVEGYGRIAAVPLSGGTPTTLVSVLLTDRPRLASAGAAVLVADGWRIKKVLGTGGGLDTVLAAGNPVVDLAADAQFAYALDSFGNVLRAPLLGGVVEPVASGLGGPAGLLRLVDGTLYWLDGGGTLRRVPAAGGSAENVATGQPPLADLTADGQFVYVAEQTSSIRRVPLDGGASTPVVTSATGPVSLAIDGSRLYWIDSFSLGKVDLASGTSQVLAIGLAGDAGQPNAIAVDATQVYWTEIGSGAIKRGNTK